MDNIAIIDIGSNSIRMLTLKDDIEQTHLVSTRLGENIDAHRLAPLPIQRTLEAIADLHAHAQRSDIDTICAFATSAVRDAQNKDALLRPLRETLGLEVDVLPGAMEAELAFMGASCGESCGVVDVGGGSTELVTGGTHVEIALSLNFGAVRLLDRFQQDRFAACAHLDQGFATAHTHFTGHDKPLWKAIGGTATTLVAMDKKIAVYDARLVHLSCLTLSSIHAWEHRLWDLPLHQRTFPGLPAHRADIIAHGALILERFMLAFALDTLTISTADNLHGYLALRKMRSNP